MVRLLAKFKQLRDEWNNKIPTEKWKIIYNINDKICCSIGVRVYRDMKNNWYSTVPGLACVLYFLTVIYTTYLYSDGQLLKGMQSSCISGIVITLAIMYWNAVGPNRFRLNSLVRFGGTFIYMDNHKQSKYRVVCDEYCNKLVTSILVMVMLILVSHALFSVGPIYLYIVDKKLVTPIPTELPYVDKDTTIGFAVNLFQQGILAFYELIGNITIEVALCFINNAITTMPALIHVDVEGISNELKLNGSCRHLKPRMRNVLIKIQDFDRYAESLKEIYYVRMFVAPFAFIYSICLSIFFQIIFDDFPVGYPTAMLCYMQLLMMCYMGNNVKEANESVIEELYHMHWYILPICEQKQLMSVTHRPQNGAVLSIGPFAQLDFETGSELTKVIYRYTMLLLTLFR